MEHLDFFYKPLIGYGKWPNVTTTENSVQCLQYTENINTVTGLIV